MDPKHPRPNRARADRLVSYLQKAFGYALTADVSEKVVFCLFGAGNNGKTTLLETGILQNRKRLSMGEISSIAFAHKTGQAVLTDDQKARILARTVLSGDRVQTTPHLVGWLFFTGALKRAHKGTIILQHRQSGRPLEKYFLEVYFEAERCRKLVK